MFARIPLSSLSRWGRSSLLLALSGLPLYASCTNSEDTEPFVPAAEGATQPEGSGALMSEQDACADLLKAAKAAASRLGCAAPSYPACPEFIRPAGGSGCYEYYANSVAACQQRYQGAASCDEVAPCLVSAKRNDELSTCELSGAGGSGGANPVGGAPQGGAPVVSEAGSPAAAGAAVGGQPSAGANG